jgi:cysteine desulfurase
MPSVQARSSASSARSTEPPIYLDHAATTPLEPRVVAAMQPFWSQLFGNPSSMYRSARESRRYLDSARDAVADALGAKNTEVIFTSGGTESDNAAIKGIAFARRGGHIVTTRIEHHAVLHSVQFLEKLGYRVTYVTNDEFGRVDPTAVERAIEPDTVLVSVMLANNEIGTIQPISEIARVTRAKRVPLHVDAVQAAGYIDLDVDRLGVDLLSLSGHKFYGPKGTGALYIRRGTVCWPLLHGGGQERGRRAGTENVAGIVGFAEAFRLARTERDERVHRVTAMRNRIIAGVLQTIPGAHLTGHPVDRLPNLASFCFERISGESLLLALDQRGIMASSGSACTSGSLDPSHVLLALDLPAGLAQGSLRISLGQLNTNEEIDRLLASLPPIVETLRQTEVNAGQETGNPAVQY